MQLVKPLVLGFFAVGTVVLAAAFALGILADANDWNDFRLSAGPVSFLAFDRSVKTTSSTFGPGLFLLAAAGGLLNAGAAALLRRRGTNRM